MNDLTKYLSEIIGTFGLVYVGGMAVMQFDAGNLALEGVALAHFLILSFMVYFGARFSGAHFNPAITASFVLTKKMTLKEGGLYLGSQIFGSILAGLFLIMTTTADMIDDALNGSKLGFPHVGEGIAIWQAMLIEFVFTFLLVFIVWAMTVDDRAPSQIYGLAIGGIVGMAVLAIGPLTGAALNPARVFGPALLSQNSAHGFLPYWIAPILGGLLAGWVYNEFFLEAGDKQFHLEGGEQAAKKAPAKKPAAKKPAAKKPAVKKPAAKTSDE